jgi:hypothetical protein
MKTLKTMKLGIFNRNKPKKISKDQRPKPTILYFAYYAGLPNVRFPVISRTKYFNINFR